MSDWQPIETAPEDVVVLVFDAEEGVCAAINRPINASAFWMPCPSSYESDSLRPTQWMPLPDPPSA